MESNNLNKSKYKRKRKKTFLKNARKYAKKGHYGRGSELNADTYQYFVRIMETFREGFDNDDDKRIFVNNVLEQTEKEEVNCSRNQVGCRVIEMLLPFASDLVIQRYINAFNDDLRPLCSDRFASHVLEALLKECHKRTLENSATETQLNFFVLKISKFLLNNLEDFVWDIYANHIIRSVFKNLTQLPNEVEAGHKPNTTQKVLPEYKISDDYIDIIKDYGERLLAWPQFKDLPFTEITSGMLQVLLKALVKIDMKLFKKYVQKLLNESFCADSNLESDANKLPNIFMGKPALMLLETMIETATPKHYTQIYAKLFKGNICKLSVTKNTNFAVQKLLKCCKEKIEFEEMFEEIKDYFEDILNAGNSGVILVTAECCRNLSSKQGAFVQSLISALKCESDDLQGSLLMCLCKLAPYDRVQDLKISNYEKEKLNLHGTLILQIILDFNKPIKFVNAILNMNTNDLKSLLSNTMGSHIADSYAKSKFIGEKSREKLIRKLQGTYQELASTKYGSRTFDALWMICSAKFRTIIMEELAYKDAAWSNSEFGKIIANKVNLNLYRRNKEEWKNSFNSNNTDKIKELTNLLK